LLDRTAEGGFPHVVSRGVGCGLILGFSLNCASFAEIVTAEIDTILSESGIERSAAVVALLKTAGLEEIFARGADASALREAQLWPMRTS
jgi:hypothetical protein